MHSPTAAKPHLLGSAESACGRKKNALLFGDFKDFLEESIANPQVGTMGLVPSQEQEFLLPLAFGKIDRLN